MDESQRRRIAAAKAAKAAANLPQKQAVATAKKIVAKDLSPVGDAAIANHGTAKDGETIHDFAWFKSEESAKAWAAKNGGGKVINTPYGPISGAMWAVKRPAKGKDSVLNERGQLKKIGGRVRWPIEHMDFHSRNDPNAKSDAKKYAAEKSAEGCETSISIMYSSTREPIWRVKVVYPKAEDAKATDVSEDAEFKIGDKVVVRGSGDGTIVKVYGPGKYQIKFRGGLVTDVTESPHLPIRAKDLSPVGDDKNTNRSVPTKPVGGSFCPGCGAGLSEHSDEQLAKCKGGKATDRRAKLHDALDKVLDARDARRAKDAACALDKIPHLYVYDDEADDGSCVDCNKKKNDPVHTKYKGFGTAKGKGKDADAKSAGLKALVEALQAKGVSSEKIKEQVDRFTAEAKRHGAFDAKAGDASRDELRNRYEMAKEKLTRLKNAGKPYSAAAKKAEELLVKYQSASAKDAFDAEVGKVHALYAKGMSNEQIAAKTGLSATQVAKALLTKK